METQHPGVYTQERAQNPKITGVSTATGGFVGVTEKGRTDEPMFITSFTDYQRTCGGFLIDSYVPDAVKSFFENGGQRCYVGRVVGTGALKASVTLDAVVDFTTDSVKFEALGEGAYGNALAVLVRKTVAQLDAAVTGAGVTKITLKTVRGIEVGDVLVLKGLTTTLRCVVLSINFSTREVTMSTKLTQATRAVSISGDGTTATATLADHGYTAGQQVLIAGTTNFNGLKTILTAPAGTFTFASAFLGGPETGTVYLPTDVEDESYVYTASQHRLNTQLAADLVTGATSALLVDGTLAQVGMIVTIADGTTLATVVVTGKSGNTISFAAVTLSATIAAASSRVCSQEFKLIVYDGDSVVETHEYLSMEPTNAADYIENRLAGTGNESAQLTAEDKSPAGADYLILPWTQGATLLAAGADGSTPTDDQYIGGTLPSSGLHLFDRLTDVNMISVPGITTQAVATALIDYCELRADVMAVVSAPLAVDTDEEAREYMQITLNKNSSYYALYFPWIEVRDPFDTRLGNTRRRTVPPDGFVQGCYADTDAQRGVHKAPANTSLRGPLALTAEIGDASQDILNPIGVNCLRVFPGEGIKLFGARTGWKTQDGFHYINVRRLVNFVKASVKEGIRWALFEPIQPVLYEELRRSIGRFLHDMWRQGMLYPSNDVSQAYFVKVDEENNMDSDRLAGRVNIELGINPPYPAEFVILTVSLWDGDTQFSENIGGLA